MKNLKITVAELRKLIREIISEAVGENTLQRVKGTITLLLVNPAHMLKVQRGKGNYVKITVGKREFVGMMHKGKIALNYFKGLELLAGDEPEYLEFSYVASVDVNISKTIDKMPYGMTTVGQEMTSLNSEAIDNIFINPEPDADLEQFVYAIAEKSAMQKAEQG